MRHSSATHAEIRSTVKDGKAKLVIADNGCGFKKSKIRESGGLNNITRRIEDMGGTVDIDSAPGSTSITVVVPS